MAKRGSSGDVAVVVGVVLLAALAFAGALVLAVGVLVAVGMLIAWGVRGLSAASERRAIKRSEAVVESEPCTHVQLAPIAPGVFDDLVTTDDGAPVDPQRLVRATELRHRYVGRLVTTFEQRKPVERRRPAVRRTPTPKPLLAGEDLWRLSEDELKSATTHFALCDGCAGAGSVACGACVGRGTVRCSNCSGAGKAYDYAKNGSRRLMNCRVCDKRGSVTCRSCLAGRLRCGTCAGTGTLECWAVCERTTRDDVQVEPDGAAVGAAFDWCRDGLSVPDAVIGQDAQVLGALAGEGAISRHEIEAQTGKAWIDAHWSGIQPKPMLGERMLRQRFTHLEIPVVLVEWGRSAPSETLALEGRRMLAPSRGATANPFASVVRMTTNVAVGLATVPVVAALGYLVRGAFFVRVETVLVVGLVAAASTLLALAVARTLRDDRLGRVLAAAAVATAAGLVPAARSAEPSIELVRASIAAGDVEAAQRTLEVLPASAEEAARLRTEIALYLLAKAQTSKEAKAAAAALVPGGPEAAQAAARVDELLISEARGALAQNAPLWAEALLVDISDEAARAAMRMEVNRHRIAACLANSDFACAEKLAVDARDSDARALVRKSLDAELARRKVVRAKTKPAAVGAQAQRAAGALEQRAAAFDVEDNSELIPALRSLEEELDRSIDADVRQRALREESKPAWQGVLCCDGTRSPTCSSRRRGCCSGHGGVCGG